MKEKNRISWLDIAKAFAIIMVVFGHTVRDGNAQLAVYGFHVPLFFLTAGMSAAMSGQRKGRIWKDFRRIMVPYYIWGLVSIGIYAVLGGVAQAKFGIHTDLSPIKNIGGLLYGSPRNNYMQYNLPLWFLPCLFAVKLMYYGLQRIMGEKKLGMLVISLCIAAVSFGHSALKLPYLPFSLEIAAKMLPLFMLGNWAIGQETLWGAFEKRRWLSGLAGGALVIAAMVLATFNQRPQYHLDQFPGLPLFVCVALLGSFGVLLLSVCIKNSKWLSYRGRNTLAILVMHKFPVMLFQMAGPFAALLNDGRPLIPAILAGALVTAVAVGACLAVAVIVKKICPVALAGSKQ